MVRRTGTRSIHQIQACVLVSQHLRQRHHRRVNTQHICTDLFFIIRKKCSLPFIFIKILGAAPEDDNDPGQTCVIRRVVFRSVEDDVRKTVFKGFVPQLRMMYQVRCFLKEKKERLTRVKRK